MKDHVIPIQENVLTSREGWWASWATLGVNVPLAHSLDTLVTDDLCSLAWWQGTDNVTPTGVGFHPGAQNQALCTSWAPPHPLQSIPEVVVPVTCFLLCYSSNEGEAGGRSRKLMPQPQTKVHGGRAIGGGGGTVRRHPPDPDSSETAVILSPSFPMHQALHVSLLCTES